MKSTHKKRNVNGQCEKFVLGTQRDLYSTCSRWGFAVGVKQILAFALGVCGGGKTNFSVRVGGKANFSVHVGDNANFSVFKYQHYRIGGIFQCEPPMREVLRCSGIIYRL